VHGIGRPAASGPAPFLTLATPGDAPRPLLAVFLLHFSHTYPHQPAPHLPFPVSTPQKPRAVCHGASFAHPYENPRRAVARARL
jgi:hypothetical protein